jgi:predicted RNA-binding Zn-ribbon protein involved in translation (DUF1610 family)
MKCPNCGEEITTVTVNSNCFQIAQVEWDEQTELWNIRKYGSAYVEDTISMECPECLEKIPDLPNFVDLIGMSREELLKFRQRQGGVDFRIESASDNNTILTLDAGDEPI